MRRNGESVSVKFSKLKHLFIIACALVCMSGCSVYQVTGDTITGYTRNHLIPYLMEEGTLDSACGLGLSMGGFLNSFERVTDAAHRAAIPTLVSAASCFQEDAWQAELRYLRAIRATNATDARDARTAEQIAHHKAAEALNKAYGRTVELFGEATETRCPALETDEDQLVWLMGMLAGVQAVQHDGASLRAVGVPMDVPVKAMRGMRCLDNQKWWGMPRAVTAAVWMIVPGSGDGAKNDAGQPADSAEELESSMKLAEKSDIKAAFAIAGMVYENSGDTESVMAVVSRYHRATAEVPMNRAKRLLELNARRQLLAASDRLWTKEKGYRTPFGQFGSFPVSVTPAGSAEDESLLDDL